MLKEFSGNCMTNFIFPQCRSDLQIIASIHQGDKLAVRKIKLIIMPNIIKKKPYFINSKTACFAISISSSECAEETNHAS